MFENDDINSSFSGGFLASQTPALERKQNVRGRQAQAAPVAVATIHEMLPGQEHLRIGSQEFSNVTIIGIVRSVNREGAAIYYDIDDMSGPPVLVRQYVENEDNDVAPMENTYARATGVLKSFNEKRSVMCHDIRPLTDMGELSAHLLEIVQCRLFYTKDVLRAHSEKATGGGYGASMNTSAFGGGSTSNYQTTSSSSNYGNNTGGNQQQFSNRSSAAPVASNVGNKNDPAQMIYAFLQQSKATEEGIFIQDILTRFKHINPNTVKQHLDFLTNEGQVYTTVDDDHFKVTE